MTKPNEKLVEFPRQSARDILTDVLRDGAQQMLATAIEAEVDDYLAGRASTGLLNTTRQGRSDLSVFTDCRVRNSLGALDALTA